jgi:hypothetical protein
MYWWLNATFPEAASEKHTKENAYVESDGDFSKLEPPSFKPYAVGAGAPYKSKVNQEFYAYEKKLISRLTGGLMLEIHRFDKEFLTIMRMIAKQ